MKSIVLLPKTVMNLIALFTGEHNVLIALKNEIDYDMLIHGIHPEKTLLYGPVQSGKTEAIVFVDVARNAPRINARVGTNFAH